MSETLQLQLAEDEKKIADDDDDILSTDAKAAALATSALRMAEEAKRAAELLAEVKATLRENRIYPERPRSKPPSKRAVPEIGDGVDVDEVPFLGDTYEKDANYDTEKIPSQRFDSLNNKDLITVVGKNKEIANIASKANVAYHTTRQPAKKTARETSESKNDDDDAESNPSIETEDWPEDEGVVNALARKAAIAEVSRRLAEIEARQDAVAAAEANIQHETATEQDKTLTDLTPADKAINPADNFIVANESDKPSSNCLLEEIINEEMQEMADTMASIGVCVNKPKTVNDGKDEENKQTKDEKSPSALEDSGLSGNMQDAKTSVVAAEADEQAVEVAGDQVGTECDDNIVATDVSSIVVDDAVVEPGGCMALSEEILAEEMQEVSDALASLGLGAKDNEEKKVEESNEAATTASLTANVAETREVITDELSSSDKPTESAAQIDRKPGGVPGETNSATQIKYEVVSGGKTNACLALSNEMLVEELQEVSEALVALGKEITVPDEKADPAGEKETAMKGDNVSPIVPTSAPGNKEDVSNIHLPGSIEDDDAIVAAADPSTASKADVGVNDEAAACVALSEEILAEEIQEVSAALASLGLIVKGHKQEASVGEKEKDEENREVTTSVSSSSVGGGCMPGGLPEVTAALNAIGISLDAKKEEVVSIQTMDGQIDKQAEETTSAQDEPVAAPNMNIETNDCVKLSAEMLTEEIQEVSEVLGSFGLSPKANDEKRENSKDNAPTALDERGVPPTEGISVATIAPEANVASDASEIVEKAEETGDGKASSVITGCLSGGFDDVADALSAIGLQTNLKKESDVISPTSSPYTDVKETACVQLSEKMIAEEIQEVSATLASLGLAKKDNDEEKMETIDKPADSTAWNSKAVTCLSEEMSGVSTALISAGLLPRKDQAGEESKSPRADMKPDGQVIDSPQPVASNIPNLDGFKDVATEVHSCMVLSEEMFSEELHEVSEAITSLASGPKQSHVSEAVTEKLPTEAAPSMETPVQVFNDASNVVSSVPREKSLVDEEDKPEAEGIKESSTCIEFSEQVSATMASFGLGSKPPAEQRPQEAAEKPSSAAEKAPSSGDAEVKDKASASNEMLVESMAAERANCGCIVM